MTPFEAFLEALPSVDVLVGFEQRAAVAAGVKPEQAREWGRVHDVYYGPTRFTAKQATALKQARAFPLEQLVYVEKRLHSLDDDSLRWQLRLQLLSRPGTFHTLKARADEIVPAKKPTKKASLRLGASVDGMRDLHVTGDEHRLAALEATLRVGIDKDKAAGPQMLERFWELLEGDGGVVQPVPRPQLLIPLPDYVDVLEGRGDDTVLALTDGTTLTGAEYLARYHGEALEVALFHPQAGPVNLYDTQRFANAKQRDLARLVMPGCPVPGCRHGAAHCETHHVTAVKHGGQTNMANLATLCTYHNRTNDDDPGIRRRGMIVMVNHTPVWQSPSGHLVRTRFHRFGAMFRLFGIPPQVGHTATSL